MLISLSEKLLLSIKMQTSNDEFRMSLEKFLFEDLLTELSDDQKKKAFWINCYNAFFLILRKEDQLTKPDIYTKKKINIAGKWLSLDDIEHGILRKFRYKYSLGYMANIFAAKLIKQLAVDDIDYRIHFALNCGAKSCPPIAFYQHQNIDQQLDLATQSFLESETEYDSENKVVFTSALLKWYNGDFGGAKGIRKMYKQQMGKDIRGYIIRYKDYSWEEELDNFV